MTRNPNSSSSESLGPEHRDFVSALATGLDIIRAFDRNHPRMTLSEVAARNSITRAKARRFLLTLHSLGYVEKNNRHFELAARTLDLGYAALSANGYDTVIRQRLEAITQVTGESSSMGVLDGPDVIYVARSAAPHRVIAVSLSVGSRLPAVATSMGRMLLSLQAPEALAHLLDKSKLTPYTPHTVTDRQRLMACLENIRQQDYCIVDQELEIGLRSLAVPVYNRHRRLIGALNVSTNAGRVERDQLEREFLPLLQTAAKQIEATVG